MPRRRVRRAGRGLHRRRRPRPAPHRDGPRRVAGHFRPISHGLPAVRHRPAVLRVNGASPPSSAARPTTTAAAPSTTILPRGEADRRHAALRRVLESGESVTDMQLVGHRARLPERRHWSINLYRLHSGSGRPIGVAGLATDVTRRHARRPRGRPRPPQPRPAQRGGCPHRQLARPGDHRPRAARRRRPAASATWPPSTSTRGCSPATRRRSTAAASPTAAANCAGSPSPAPSPTCRTSKRPAVTPRSVDGRRPSTATPSTRPAPARCAPPAPGSSPRPAGRRRSSSPRWSCRWSPATPSSASCSSPVPRAASPSPSATALSPSNSPPAPPSASTTPASTGASTSAP